MRLGGAGDMTAQSLLWRYDRAVPQLNSPLLYQGVLYMINDGGIVVVRPVGWLVDTRPHRSLVARAHVGRDLSVPKSERAVGRRLTPRCGAVRRLTSFCLER